MVGYNGVMKDREEKTEGKKRSKKSGLGLALWLLAALGLLILFLVYQDKIITNLKDADFFHRIFGKTPTFVEQHEEKPQVNTEKNDVPPVAIDVTADDKTPVSGDKTGVVAKNDAADTIKEKTVDDTSKGASGSDASTAKNTGSTGKSESAKSSTEKNGAKPIPSTPTTIPAEMNLKLCFMEIDSDGSVNRHEVTRKMKKSARPLADAVNALIAGPTAEEEKAGCRSLIPADSKLLGATVKDGVATLNFSGEFEFNQYGVEGTLGQLQQIVFTATAFPTVESVQFLVDGEKKDYLGSEGVWIGTPLNRNTYK